MNKTEEQFARLLLEDGLSLTEKQTRQFDIYFHELVAWNEKMNLTGITERDQVYVKHFFDSLTLARTVPMQTVGRMADIGSGAGFPGIPIKIMFPHIRLTIVDSLNKRIQFLSHLVNELELHDVECVHGRAEDAARKPEYRDRFDLVSARAVARLQVLNELCLPFAKPNGLFAAMKGSDPTDEIGDAARSMKELKAELVKVTNFTLPLEDAERHIVLLRKTGPTPKMYPRKAGLPLKMPLA